MIDRGGTLVLLIEFEWSIIHGACTIRPLVVTHLARFAVTVAQMVCLTPGAGASTGAFPSHCMLRISCPYYIGRRRKVGTVRDDALVMTKILYSRGTSDRVEQYIRLTKP